MIKKPRRDIDFTYHGDHPKLFEYDPKNDIVDVFVYRDPYCPYPYTITNTRRDTDIWTHQGFSLLEFCIFVDNLFRRYNLPYRIKKKESKEAKKIKQGLGDFL